MTRAATIDWSQCTIYWYVDDTKISHQDPKVVDRVIEVIEKRFGKMTVKRGASHTFVGMDFTFREDGKVEILMKEYLQECLDSYAEVDKPISKKANTPGKSDLFYVDHDSREQDNRKAEMFHHIVAKLLYVSKSAFLDNDLVISFLCKRVAQPTEHDWHKLTRLLNCINGTMEMTRITGADDLSKMKA